MANKKALALPDSLIVRYYRGGEIEHIHKVTTLKDGRIEVRLRLGGAELKSADRHRTDIWRDLGGGLGFVPDA